MTGKERADGKKRLDKIGCIFIRAYCELLYYMTRAVSCRRRFELRCKTDHFEIKYITGSSESLLPIVYEIIGRLRTFFICSIFGCVKNFEKILK